MASERIAAPEPASEIAPASAATPSTRRFALAVVLEAAFALAAFTALALWLTWPVARDLDGSMYGYPGDATGAVALLDWFSGPLGYDVFGTSHVEWIGAPFGSEYPNALNIQWALLFGPATLAAKAIGEVAAYNLLVISGLTLSGASMYGLVRVLACPWPVAAWAGLAYTIFPWHIEKAQGHVGFVHLEGFPLLILAALAWYRRPTVLRGLGVAGATLFLWLTAGYFGVLGSVSAATLITVAALLAWRRDGLRAAAPRYVATMGLVLAVPALVYAASIGGSADGVGNPRSPAELFVYGARPWEYLLPSYRNPYFGDDVGNWLLGHLHGSNFSETSLYVGWLTIVLALIWLVAAVARRARLSADYAFLSVALPVLIVVAGAFSLPSPLPRTDVPTPSRVLWELAPQFRVPSRFVAVVMTGVVILAALGLAAVSRWIANRRGTSWPSSLGAAAVCALAGAVSLVELSITASPATFDVSTVPGYYRYLERAPRGILVEYPLARADQGVNSDYLFWQREHGRRLLNGAQLGTFPDAVGQALADPASPEAPAALAALGVSVVVVRPNTYALTGGAPGLPRLGRGYRQLGSEAGAVVWLVSASPAPAVAAFRDGFGATETPPGARAGRWLNADSGIVELYARRAGTYRARFRMSSYGRFRLVRIRGDDDSTLVGVASERMIEIRLRLPRGRSHVVLDARPGAEPIPDGRHVSVHVGNWQLAAARGRLASDPLEPLAGESG